MLDRKSPPSFVSNTSFDLIKPVRETLANGIDIFFISGGGQDVIKIELLFKAGRWYESKNGTSQLTANLLTKGTISKNSFEIASIFDRFGAHVEINPGFDFASVSLYTVTKYLKPVLDLFIEVIVEPVFPEKELTQHQAVVIQNIKVNEEKTSYLASKAFRKKLFGADHPYGKEVEEQDVNSIKRADLTDFFNGSFVHPSIFVSGKITGEDAKLIAATFSLLASRTPSPVIKKIVATQKFDEHITKEGSVQSTIRTGRRSVVRGQPDYPLVLFVNHILGGYFGSRLMKNIREEKGLTYGIYSSLQPFLHESFIVIGADVNNENVELALSEIRKELKILRTVPVPQEELTTAKNHFIGSLQSEISTPFAHADKIKTMYLSQLPTSYYQQLIERINGITFETVLDTSEKHFHEETFSRVSVG